MHEYKLRSVDVVVVAATSTHSAHAYVPPRPHLFSTFHICVSLIVVSMTITAVRLSEAPDQAPNIVSPPPLPAQK